MIERHFVVAGLPIVLVEPATSGESALPVLWLTHLGGSKEQTLPMLHRLADAGHPAFSFDPPGHGERAVNDDNWGLAARTLASFRRLMWAQLGETTLESLRVLDWAASELDHDGDLLAGGVSMGGDVSVALAGIDERIARVASVGSTPNWERPGMRDLDDPTAMLDQGEPDSYSAWLRGQLDPMLHLERYARGVPIAFECGGEDHHVPVANSQAFEAALSTVHPDAGAAVRVTSHAGLDHMAVTQDESALDACAAWLTA